MKQFSDITGLLIILFVVIKIIDFTALGVVDVILLALAGVYVVITVAVMLKGLLNRGKDL